MTYYCCFADLFFTASFHNKKEGRPTFQTLLFQSPPSIRLFPFIEQLNIRLLPSHMGCSTPPPTHIIKQPPPTHIIKQPQPTPTTPPPTHIIKQPPTNKKHYQNSSSIDKHLSKNQQSAILRNLNNANFKVSSQIVDADEDESVYIYINDQKRKMDKKLYQSKKGKESRNVEISKAPQSRPFRNSIEMVSHNTSGLKENCSQSKTNVPSQPFIISLQVDRQRFKKPLKLLKKKLKEKKMKEASQSHSQPIKLALVNLYNNHKAPFQADYRPKHSKTRSITEEEIQVIEINTSLAQAERERYYKEQNVMRRQRELQRAKWQQQLSKEASAYRQSFAYRYGYRRLQNDDREIGD